MTETRDTPPNDYLVGLDLGQSRDYTALTVAEIVGREPNRYDVRAIERSKPRRYQDVIARVAEIVPKLREGAHVLNRDGRTYDYLRPTVTLVVDRTGVGRAVGDLFSEADLDVDLQLVSIHGGAAVGRDDDGAWSVPKRDLVGVVAVALQNGRLRWAEGLKHADTLRDELQNFRATIAPNGHTSYGAGDDWREGNHDDLVLAVALSLWWGERPKPQGLVPGYPYREAFAGIL